MPTTASFIADYFLFAPDYGFFVLANGSSKSVSTTVFISIQSAHYLQVGSLWSAGIVRSIEPYIFRSQSTTCQQVAHKHDPVRRLVASKRRFPSCCQSRHSTKAGSACLASREELAIQRRDGYHSPRIMHTEPHATKPTGLRAAYFAKEDLPTAQFAPEA